MINSVTAKWTKQKRAEIRHADAAARRSERMTKPDKPMSIKEAAWKAMPAAYAKAAGGVGKANPRQIMYAARGPIQEMIGKPLGKNFEQIFHPRPVARLHGRASACDRRLGHHLGQPGALPRAAHPA